MGNFLKDLDTSYHAVQLVMIHLINNDYICYELVTREEQKSGDIRIVFDDTDIALNIEVKFDLMAEKTGNLCFELSNGKKLTGILDTSADEVFYVVPSGNTRRIFKFEIDKLRKYILKPENVISKKGGDNKKFDLALVSIDKIIEDGIPFEVVEIDAELHI